VLSKACVKISKSMVYVLMEVIIRFLGKIEMFAEVLLKQKQTGTSRIPYQD
jgi:hypothetical protein